MNQFAAITCLTLTLFLGSSQVCLGAEFEKGMAAFDRKDYTTALREWKVLANDGAPRAQNSIGSMYDRGRGVAQDFESALKWYTLAAKQDTPSAQRNLGVMYHNGQGVLKDIVYAHLWLNLAAANGDKTSVGYLDRVAKKMTPAQQQKAQDLARQCVRRKYKGC